MRSEAIDRLQQLTQEGFCVIEGVLPTEMVERLRRVSDQMLAGQDDTHFEAQRSTGSMIPVNQHPFMAELIAYPAALALEPPLGGSLLIYPDGGGGGIRTPETRIRGLHDFESCAFNRTLPPLLQDCLRIGGKS